MAPQRTAEQLVAELKLLAQEIDEHRHAMAEIATKRSAAARELLDLVGGTRAAALLGIERQRIYALARRAE